MTEGPLFYVHAYMAYRVLNSKEGGLQEHEIVVKKIFEHFYNPLPKVQIIFKNPCKMKRYFHY